MLEEDVIAEVLQPSKEEGSSSKEPVRPITPSGEYQSGALGEQSSEVKVSTEAASLYLLSVADPGF